MNNSTIIPFQFNTSTVRVLTLEDGTVFFVAKDVAVALGYKDTVNAVLTHCKYANPLKDIGVVIRHPYINQALDPQIKLIPESDVHRLILRSKLESAVAFQDWVVEEVLPSIRRTGSYGPALAHAVDPRKLKTAFTSFHAIAKICGLKGNQAVLCADKATKNLEGHSPVQLLGIELKSEYAEVLLTPRDIGTQLGISAHAANLRLKLNGFVEDIRDAKNRLLWQPTEKGMPYAEMLDAHKAHSDGTPIQQLKWKSSILSLLGEAAA